MTRSAKLTSTTLMAAGALALHLTVTPAMAGFVDCSKFPPDSIQDQLNFGDTGITINGTCFEDIFVPNDGVFFGGSFDADGPHGIVGRVIMDSVQRIVFFNLTLNGPIHVAEGSTVELHNTRITGPGNLTIGNNSVAQFLPGSSVADKDGSVVVQNGGAVVLNGAHITTIRDFFVNGSNVQMIGTSIRDISGSVFINNGSNVQMNGGEIVDTENGIFVVRGSVARFRNVTLGPARDDSGASCTPLCAGDNSDVRLDSTTVNGRNNDPAVGGAVTAFRNSSLLIRGNSSIINDGTQPAIGLFHDSSVRQDGGDGPITLGGGVALFGLSYGDFRNAVIDGDVNVDLKSIFRFRSTDPGNPSVVNGNVTLSKGSTMDATKPAAVVNGNVTCAELGSVLYGSVGGSGQRKCLSHF